MQVPWRKHRELEPVGRETESGHHRNSSACSINAMDSTDRAEAQPLLRYELDRSFRGNIQGRNDPSRRGLSMFFGVLVPCVLCMFSAILFLRLGFALGQAGFYQTVGMYGLGYFIVTLTTLSLSAISTNGAIEGGGAYFMISRALGPEFGGGIGVMFFFANICSSSLYCIGFTEALVDNFGTHGIYLNENSTFHLPVSGWYTISYASGVLLFSLIVCIIGAQMFAKTQLIIFLIVMVAISSAIVSFFVQDPLTIEINHNSTVKFANYTGLSVDTFLKNLGGNYTVDYTTKKTQDFVSVFAVIFNGCVGIMAGANISGELKNPSKSIPLGTLGALAYTLIIYIILIVFVCFTCSRELLINDYNFLQSISSCPPLIALGIFAATLSAALSALIGGSRILMALAKDNLFGPVLWPVNKLVTSGENPIGAVLVSWFIAQLIILIGELNMIAALVSIFFLLSYASVNLACLGLELASAPNFRPSFKYFSWHTCLLGLLGCLIMMFLIQPLFGFISVVVFTSLVVLVHLIGSEPQWGYISQALIFHQVRKYLLKLDIGKHHVKFWRPQVLLLVSNPRSSCQLIEFVNDMKKSGLYVIGHVKVGMLDNFPTDPVESVVPAWMKVVKLLKVKAFVEMTLSSSVREGAQHLMRISGLGGMKPNTVVLGFYDNVKPTDNLSSLSLNGGGRYGAITNSEDDADIMVQIAKVRDEEQDRHLTPEEYVSIINDAIYLQKNICLARNFQEFDRNSLKIRQQHYIDVWPVNFLKPETSGYLDTACIFLLQLACVVHMVPLWNSNSKLRVFLCVDSDYTATTHKKSKLTRFLQELRIKAEIVTVPWNHITQLNRLSDIQDEDSDGLASNLIMTVSEDYLQAINTMVKDYATSTTVVFCYLPLPPVDGHLHKKYLHHVNLMTKNLPPTMMVHGISEVTLTAL